jgi:hypothetical protein
MVQLRRWEIKGHLKSLSSSCNTVKKNIVINEIQ